MAKTRKLLMVLLCAMAGCTRLNGVSNCECQDPESGCPGSPILIDLMGDGIHLTTAVTGVDFALVPGMLRRWAWTQAGSDDAWIALDRNGNGIIDDGSELFGDHTEQPPGDSPNGFSALAVFDDDHNGAIDQNDSVWTRLRLWTDADHDGISQPDELVPLSQHGIHGISLAYSASPLIDDAGNMFKFSAGVDADAPVGMTAYDVWLRSTTLRTTQYTCWAWGYFHDNTGNDPCYRPYVLGDPIATDGDGHLARLVARAATSTSQSTARVVAIDRMVGAVNPRFSCGLDTFCCQFANYPSPDYFRPPSETVYGGGWYKTWCESYDDGGGGSGGGGGAGSCY